MEIEEGVKPRANGRNIVGRQLPTLLDVTCCVRLHTLLHVVAQSLKPVKLFSQQLPTFLLFLDRRSVAPQCWIRLHSSSNIVGATHAHYAWFTKTYGLYPSHVALQVPTLLGVVASFCTTLPTRTLNSQHCGRNNVGSCCVRCTQLKSILEGIFSLFLILNKNCTPLHVSKEDSES